MFLYLKLNLNEKLYQSLLNRLHQSSLFKSGFLMPVQEGKHLHEIIINASYLTTCHVAIDAYSIFDRENIILSTHYLTTHAVSQQRLPIV